MRIGLREANQRFSRAMKAVKVGEKVVAERGDGLRALFVIGVAFPNPTVPVDGAARRLRERHVLLSSR